MKDIQWMVNSRRSYEKDGKEVRITITKMGRGDRLGTNIIFKNQSEQKISHTGYMLCGISLNRIYFKEDIAGRGYKISSHGHNKRVALPSKLEDFVGTYNLHYDSREELYFIEKEGTNA